MYSFIEKYRFYINYVIIDLCIFYGTCFFHFMPHKVRFDIFTLGLIYFVPFLFGVKQKPIFLLFIFNAIINNIAHQLTLVVNDFYVKIEPQDLNYYLMEQIIKGFDGGCFTLIIFYWLGSRFRKSNLYIYFNLKDNIQFCKDEIKSFFEKQTRKIREIAG